VKSDQYKLVVIVVHSYCEQCRGHNQIDPFLTWQEDDERREEVKTSCDQESFPETIEDAISNKV
jgi:hypothetical protein